MNTLEILKERRKEILHDQIKDLIVNGTMGLSGVFAAGAVLAAFAFYFGEGITLNFWITFPVFIISAIVIKKINPYQRHFTPKNHRLIFKQFYSYYNKLIQLELKKSNSIKNTISATKSFAYTMDGWVYNVVPSAIKIIPNSLKSILDHDVVHILESKDNEKIEKLQSNFLNLCNLLSIRELTYDEWIKTVKNIRSISTGKNIESIELVEIIRDEKSSTLIPSKPSFSLGVLTNPKFYLLVIFTIIFGTLMYDQPDIGMSLVYAGMGTGGIVAALTFVKMQNKFTLN